MKIKRKTRISLSLFVLSVFLFQNCATIIRGTSQIIPVTSNPIGAKIIVDGEEMGYAPLNLKLKRKKDHVILVEKQGYNPLEIRILRKSSSFLSILGNLIWGVIGALPGAFIAWEGGMRLFFSPLTGGLNEEETEKMNTGSILALLGFIIGWGGAVLVDSSSGANHTLSTKELDVTLTKIEIKPQLNLILINADKFQDIKWIRIKCADNEREDIINFN